MRARARASGAPKGARRLAAAPLALLQIRRGAGRPGWDTPNARAHAERSSAPARLRLCPMSSATGQVVFLGALAGMAVGLVIAGVMSLDVIKETDIVANNMVKPAAPPPPSPPNLRRLEELDRVKQNLFAFSPEEEKRVLREVQQSMTSARAAAAAATKSGA